MADAEDKKKVLKMVVGRTILQPAGRKFGSDYPILSKKSDDTIFPSLHLSSDEAPALKGHNVGDKITLVAHALVDSHDLNESSDSKREHFRLKLHHLGVVNPEEDSKK